MKRFLSLLLTLLMTFSLASAQAATLRQGSTGKSVTALQNRLNELGLSSGKADGIYGEKTAAAVQEAQRLLMAAGYSVVSNGVADVQTQNLIYDEDAEDALRTLLKGSTGSRVGELQNRLIELGFLKTAADGVYGSLTEAAVKAFQQQMLPEEQTGAVTPAVWELLMSDLSTSGIQAPVYFDESNPSALTPAWLYAPACILIDAPSGNVLFEHNADERMYPASTTKIVTLLLALQSMQLDQTVTIPRSAADIPADSSLVPVYPGETMSTQDLLHGLMIRSGNDAANAVAELCAETVDSFAEQMNEFAAQIGMKASHFTNPHGYHDPEHYTTARDLAVAARLGLTDPQFCQIVTCMNYTMAPTARRSKLVLQNIWEIFDPNSEYYIPGAAGVKSGYTSAAGFCYVGAAQRNGRTLIAVILGETTRSRAWIDLRRLFEYGFDIYY